MAISKGAWITLGIVGLVVFAYEFSDAFADPTVQSDEDEGGGVVAATKGAILSAISSFENVASSHNNPGGICASIDANGNCTGPKTFATLDDGIQAAENLIQKILDSNPGITIADFVKKWSGASGNTLSNYQNHVSDALGADSPSNPISGYDGGDDDGDDGTDTYDDDDDQ